MFIGNGINLQIIGSKNIYNQKTATQNDDYLEYHFTLPIQPGTDYIIYRSAFNTWLATFGFNVECYAELF